MFDLVRPCKNCPFRKGMGERFCLTRARLEAIKRGEAFQCHKTVDYEHWRDHYKRQGDHPQQCAGLMAVLARDGCTNMIMQVAERWGVLDLTKLDPRNEAYATWAQVIAAHGGKHTNQTEMF